MRIDSHQHFWIYDPDEHVWMDDRMATLKKPHLPSDLLPNLQSIEFDGAVTVQARQLIKETEWLLKLADTSPFIEGVVGWIDLCSDKAETQLERFSHNPVFKGVRHVVHDEPDDHFMLREDFLRGLKLLPSFTLPYDLLLFPKHIPVAIQVVEKLPDLSFVVDHIGKPPIKSGIISPWKEDISELAQHENVFCKLSGLVTEADWQNWDEKQFYPYLDVVYEAFGPERLMIGSDWPVCTLAGDYKQVMGIVMRYVQQFSEEIQNKIMGETCQQFYGRRL